MPSDALSDASDLQKRMCLDACLHMVQELVYFGRWLMLESVMSSAITSAARVFRFGNFSLAIKHMQSSRAHTCNHGGHTHAILEHVFPESGAHLIMYF